MYNKIQSLNRLVKMGINIHKYKIPNTFNEFMFILNEYQYTCTVRCDHETKSKDLPFYIVKSYNYDYFKAIWDGSVKNNYKLIVANGLRYDRYQYYNLVVKFDKSGDFFVEVSKLKAPLRTMYKFPEELTTLIGNIDEDIVYWKAIGKLHNVDKTIVRNDLRKLIDLGIYGKWLECTFYPDGVGELNKPYVVWQITD